MVLRIGTRGSQLALTQTGMVADAIAAATPSVTCELVRITTTGDVRRTDDVVGIERPEAPGVEPTVCLARLANADHRTRRCGVQGAPALAAAPPADLGKVLANISFHASIVTRL